jgi:hypothetical protein
MATLTKEIIEAAINGFEVQKQHIHAQLAELRNMLSSDVSQTGKPGGFDTVNSMRRHRPALFRGRHFQDHVIVLCVRWYLRYCLTLRDLEELIGWSMIARVGVHFRTLQSPARCPSQA